MKKLLFALCAAFFMLTGCGQNDGFDSGKIYYFYAENCGHCRAASAYINKHHPNLEIVKVDVATKEGFDLMVKAAKKFKLGNQIGTPMFVIGDNYVMGWAPRQTAKFEALIKPYLK